MPKDTFLKLDNNKREAIIKAFLTEFTINSFDEASISKVVKRLGIAKGSIYQYFDNKIDLYTFLLHTCAVKKKEYLTIDRKQFSDFWAYFMALYKVGYQFDHEHPLKSHFLHRLMQNVNSPSIRPLYSELKEQSINGFKKMVDYEIKTGMFRNDISVKLMGHMLYKTGVAIMDYLEHERIIVPLENLNKELPVFHNKKDILLKIVDEHIKLIRSSFDKL